MAWARPLRRRLTACWVVGIIGARKLDSIRRGVGDIEGAIELTPQSIWVRKVS
jgi:hypothetical protein